ncbi:hypothetical protein QAD02_002055 [Eretmocerus hayati]|uniref:Uncharacterized protein n=1 Tax=Eretmocerus hayati TaxID=131215 RepID=A0ACC2NJH8_9HYME|nr:hypothetical protein QAD02_002055 [Eretmocerus hayati]
MEEPVPTTEISKKICAIDREAVHRICSGQVVLNLATAVKELVENSLDSGATSIEIRLIDYGKSCITVIDNGCGVLEKDFEGLGLKHHTSKLKEFSDLLEVGTFGFRGEALSSLCSLSNLSITTKHISSSHAFKLMFDKNGILIRKRETARQQGTTVCVENIFKNLPVRAKEFERNIKKEFSKMVQVLYSYCLVATGVKINCTNAVGNKPSTSVISTTGSVNAIDNITTLFGRKVRESLIEIKAERPSNEILEEFNLPTEVAINFTWDCHASTSSHTLGRSTPDRQFFYVNGRPCDPAKISKLINHIYHKYNNKQYPFVFLNIKLKKNCTDINVTPDKRTILFTQENLILAAIKASFDKAWNIAQGTFTIKTLEELNFKLNKRVMLDSPEESPPLKKITNQQSNYKNREDEKTLKISENLRTKLDRFRSKNNDDSNRHVDEEKSPPPSFPGKASDTHDDMLKEIDEKSNSLTEKKCMSVAEGDEYLPANGENDECIKTEEMPTLVEIAREKSYENQLCTDSEWDNHKQNKLKDVSMIINLDSIKNKLGELKNIQESITQQNNRLKYRTKLSSKASDVEKEFEKELSKESFNKMQIIGQFNLGFILVKLEGDIFIIDQHASDEKYRFEKLSDEIKLKTQKLIAPKSLNLSVLNESILIDHQHIFQSNGFTFNINYKSDPGNRVHLTGMPVSFDWQFGQEDIEELVFLIREGGIDGSGTNKIPRPSRVCQMLASRACRGAVMIGKALDFVDMRRLLTQMSQMKNPWNCPHGRPTLRHLISLNFVR